MSLMLKALRKHDIPMARQCPALERKGSINYKNGEPKE